jgi:bromodomain adjacent to zinc finger domain protein 1A
MDAEELPCGRGGGTDFVTQLMRAQGLQREADWLQRRILTLRGNLETSHGDSLDRWYCYSEPEDVSVTV